MNPVLCNTSCVTLYDALQVTDLCTPPYILLSSVHCSTFYLPMYHALHNTDPLDNAIYPTYTDQCSIKPDQPELRPDSHALIEAR